METIMDQKGKCHCHSLRGTRISMCGASDAVWLRGEAETGLGDGRVSLKLLLSFDDVERLSGAFWRLRHLTSVPWRTHASPTFLLLCDLPKLEFNDIQPRHPAVIGYSGVKQNSFNTYPDFKDLRGHTPKIHMK